MHAHCNGHARVKGNERADRLADTATIQKGLLGKSEVLRQVGNVLQASDQALHHSINRLQELEDVYRRAMGSG